LLAVVAVTTSLPGTTTLAQQAQETHLRRNIAAAEMQQDALQAKMIELLSGERSDETDLLIRKLRDDIVKTRAGLEQFRTELQKVEGENAEHARQQDLAKLKATLEERNAQLREANAQLADFERERETPAADAELRIFRLRFLKAQEAALTISEIVGSQGVRTSADHRANALIVSAPLEKIEVIGALLENLDVENGEAAKAPTSGGPRSLLVRVFWLADNLPEGEGQDPAEYLPGSVLKAVKGVGLESPRIVSQVVNSAVNVMGDGQGPPFLSSTSVLVGGRKTQEECSGTLRVAGDREVVLQLSVQVAEACQVEGNLTMPIGHYMVLGTANTVMSPTREMAERGRGGRGGFGGGPGGYGAEGEGGFGEAEAGTVGRAPATLKTSRFAFVVQVVEAESFAPETEK
jgi:hypothetical protein